MKTYTQFLIKVYLTSLLNVFFIFFSLILILNLLTELDFFKGMEVNFLLPLYLSFMNHKWVEKRLKKNINLTLEDLVKDNA